MRSKCASDQTPAGWNIEVGRAGAIGTLYNIGEGGMKDAPLSGREAVAVP